MVTLVGTLWQAAKVVDAIEGGTEVFHHHVDILWWYIGNMKQPGTSVKRFQHLTRIAEAVLVIPHSNAEEERLFSIVCKNKTESRSCLSLDGIVRAKTEHIEHVISVSRNDPCNRFELVVDVL